MLPLHHDSTSISSTSFNLLLWPFRRVTRLAALACLLATVGLFWLATPYSESLHHRLRPPPGLGWDLPGSPGSGGVGHVPLSKWDQRKEEVRQAYIHALVGYKQHAFPSDELLAVSGGKSNKFNGWGVTLLDSLDTMWMMGLEEEFAEAVQVVAAQNFTTGSSYAPFFETVIRYLGGLLSAYALSGEPILLSRADDLGTLLLPVFDATPSGFPAYSVNTETGKTAPGWLGPEVILFAEAASCQLEYKYLAKLTGRQEYYVAANHIMDKLYAANVEDGLFAVRWSPQGRPRDDHYSVGAAGDSGYEYLLKQYLQSGDRKALAQYLKSISGILNHLLYITPTRQLLYLASANGPLANPSVTHSQEHLACFLPGLLALGAHLIPPSLLSEAERERHRWAAQGLAWTCYVTYADMRSGLGADGVWMSKGGRRWAEALEEWEAGGRMGKAPGTTEGGVGREKSERDYQVQSGAYLLRPETVESLYVMWKTTREDKWRERGYEIFTAIEKHAKTKYGYASVGRVDDEVAGQIDDMPSFFLAETLKYLYLLFDDAKPERYPFENGRSRHTILVINFVRAHRAVAHRLRTAAQGQFRSIFHGYRWSYGNTIPFDEHKSLFGECSSNRRPILKRRNHIHPLHQKKKISLSFARCPIMESQEP
ncbi:putative glycosyl hydrolase 47 family protein [Lyophyllum shimeji]|uniref:alpha-1,2-Mannosidase n=1 Tax=Lyophyllum shimeji TaxID=47721 RepID=A0A9P3PNV9_LYOSH|nr:putative glycosyl hydrolase 47 family protein [Lyophyllum shimeji]